MGEMADYYMERLENQWFGDDAFPGSHRRSSHQRGIGRQFAAAEAQQKLENLAKVSGIDFDAIETPMLTGKVVE